MVSSHQDSKPEGMDRRVAIIGAGASGLLACRYTLEKGFQPIVFEADNDVGGVWRHTVESTRLQNVRESYRFSDFPWPSSVTDEYPTHEDVKDYLQSYAEHFAILPHVKFNSRVLHIDYEGESIEEMQSWDTWGGTGKPFGSKGKWLITVQDTKSNSTQVYQAELVILCIGRFSGIPRIPEFPENQGPDVFKGKVLHSMDYSAMDNKSAAELLKGKKITVVGSGKSALDIAAESANANGVKYPCTLVQRRSHWFLPGDKIWNNIIFSFCYFNRFSELLVHKPGESVLLCLLATLLSPLRWGICKLAENYIRWRYPVKKYGLVPEDISFSQDISSCRIARPPDCFFERLEEGSIIMKKSQSFSFCREGVLLNGEEKPVETDIVILATGFNGGQKLRNIFKSQYFQYLIYGSTNSTIHLYRQIIHPRIPQLAVIGYAEGLSNLFTSEIRCQWLAQFLDGNIKVPSIREMDKDIKLWEDNLKLHGGENYREACISITNIWYNDQLCKDMGCNPRRKKGLLSELFQPYGSTDYKGLVNCKRDI